jgi:hypothetical protein
MRRLGTLVVVLAAVLPAPAASAQEEAVRLTLLSQTTTLTTTQPLSIAVGAINETEVRYTGLTLTVSAASPIGSRSEYDEALQFGSTSPLATVTRPLEGPLEAGASRSFQPMELNMDQATLSGNALLPITVELRADGGFTPVAVLRTLAVFIAEGDAPKVPLKVSVSFVLDEPIRRAPNGVFLDDTLEQTLASEGRLETIVSALEAVEVDVTLIVSPLLLEELRDMADGYRIARGDSIEEVPGEDPRADVAGAMFERLAVIARRPGTEVVALPYASPSVPAMVGAGLDDDLAEHIRRGRDVVGNQLGVTASTTLFRPPGGAITDETLEPLRRILAADETTEALLLDPGGVEELTGLTLSPPAIALVAPGFTSIVADPVVERRLEEQDDPVLAAMHALGELSALYFEQPSLDRGAAILFDEQDRPSGDMLRTLLSGLRAVPGVSWLEGVNATRVRVAESGPEDPDPAVRDLVEPDRVGAFSTDFRTQLAETRESLAGLASVGGGQDLIDQIGRQSLLAESRFLLPRPRLAIAHLTAARSAVDRELAQVHPPADNTPVTLTSRSGAVPVTLRNDAGYAMHVTLTLRAPRLEFLGGASREVTLDQPQEAFVFPVRAQTTGRFPATVVISTPTGMEIASSTIVIRSTAYNRVALVITIGAGVFLLAWWGRGLLPRRRT